MLFFHFFLHFLFPLFFPPQQIFSKKSTTFFPLFFEFGTIFLLRVAQNLRSPILSPLEVSRDPEIENKATITGLGLGLVAEMNLVELRLVAAMNLVEIGLVADICCRWTRIGVMAADMWWRIWTWIGGEYVVVNMAATMKLVWWWYMAATMMMMRW